MLTNPYTPSGRPRVFVGREAERRRIRDQLARVIAYGEMMGPLLVATGPRGVGKTSLMRDVAAQARESGFIVAWTAGVKHQPFLADIVDRVTRGLDRSDLSEKAVRRSRISEIGVEVGIGLAKISAKFERPEQTTEPSPALLGPVEDFFRTASSLVRDAGGAGLAVVIDEIHAPMLSRRSREYDPDPRGALDAAVLLNAVQNMEGEREQYPLAVMAAGLPETKEYLTRAATFGERTHEIVLHELDRSESRALLTEPARQLDVAWEPAAADRAIAAAGGYPQALQIIGSATWDAAQPTPGDTLTTAHVGAGGMTSRAAMESLFQARWDVASTMEKQLLTAMARHTDSAVERGVVAAEMGVGTQALGMPRRNLISKGVIEARGHGVLAFTIPGFAAFVRGQEDAAQAELDDVE